MSAFCPEGIGTCKDAAVGPCVVGKPCALHPVTAATPSDGQGDRLTEAWLAHRWDMSGPTTCTCGWDAGDTDDWLNMLAAHAVERILRDRARPADEDGLRAAIEALCEGPMSDGYRPYAIQVPGGVQLAVLLDDLRAVLAAHPEPATPTAEAG